MNTSLLLWLSSLYRREIRTDGLLGVGYAEPGVDLLARGGGQGLAADQALLGADDQRIVGEGGRSRQLLARQPGAPGVLARRVRVLVVVFMVSAAVGRRAVAGLRLGEEQD